jgi:hypothetical protein
MKLRTAGGVRWHGPALLEIDLKTLRQRKYMQLAENARKEIRRAQSDTAREGDPACSADLPLFVACSNDGRAGAERDGAERDEGQQSDHADCLNQPAVG